MKYLQIIKQMETHEAVQPDHALPLRNEIDEIDELSSSTVVLDSSISSISFSYDTTAVDLLRLWLDAGILHTLPNPIPGFVDELAQYSDRARLIGMVKAILDAVPMSLTAQERAVQFVALLTPLLAGGVA